MSLQDIDRDILDDDLRIWILSNDQRVQRKSKIDSVRSFFEARLERVLNLTENKWKVCVDKVILNNEQDDRLYVKLEDPNGGFERSIDLPGGHYTNSFEIVQEVDTLLRNRSFVDPLKLHKEDQYKFGVFFGFNNKQWCFNRGSIMLKLHGDEDYCTLWQKIVKPYNDKVFFVGKDGKKYLRRYDLKKTGHNIFRDKYVVHELAGEKAGLSDSVWKDVFSNSTVLPYRGDIATADDSSPFRMVTFLASTYGVKFDQFFFAVSDRLKILLRSFASNYIGSSGPGIRWTGYLQQQQRDPAKKIFTFYYQQSGWRNTFFFTLKSATWKNQLFASSTVLWRSRVFEATDVLRVESDVDVIVKSRRYEDFQLVLPRSIDYDRRTMLQDIFELGDAMRELRPTHVNIELLNMFCKYHDASRRGEEQHMFLKNVPLTRTVENPLVFVESYRDREKKELLPFTADSIVVKITDVNTGQTVPFWRGATFLCLYMVKDDADWRPDDE